MPHVPSTRRQFLKTTSVAIGGATLPGWSVGTIAKAERAREKHGGRATIYDDYRRLLQRSDIDVIVNATPDHWHTAINIAACQASKDIDTGKLCHTRKIHLALRDANESPCAKHTHQSDEPIT